MQQTENFEKQFRLKAYFAFGAILIILLNRFLSDALFFQMSHPVFLFDEKEIAYKIFFVSGIAQFITSNTTAAITFDVLLFVLPILFLFTLNRISVATFTILLLVYFSGFNLVTGHHYHGLVGAIIISIPFWTKKETRFNFLWGGARYYLLYVFASASLWKVFRGVAFYPEQLSNILKLQQIDLLLQSPNSFHAHAVQYLISHPEISHLVLMVTVAVQLTFLIGFFTKKYDYFLFWLAIIFCVVNYFVMSIVSVELLILNLTLLNWKKTLVMPVFKKDTKGSV